MNFSTKNSKLKTDLSYAFGLPPGKAIEYFKSKGYAFSWNWQDTWQEAHAKAFTVAKAMRMDVLQDIRDEVQKALDEGITFQQFKKELTPKLQAKGWWGRKLVGDEQGAKEVQLGSPRRLQTIYQANVQTAYMAGRYKEMMENVEDRPYWQYVAVLDSKTRPAHRALNGKVFRYDDPFWKAFYPPNGWNCRCRVRALSAQNLKDRGLEVSSGADYLREEEVLISKAGDKAKVTVYTDPKTGRDIHPDAGWSYNPGEAAWFPDLNRYDYNVAKKWVEGGLTGPGFAAFFEGITGGNYPVAVIDDAYKAAIGAQSRSVLLSSETLAKNKEAHPELVLEDYATLPDIIGQAQLIVQDKANTFVFMRVGKDVYFGAIKRTVSGETNFLTSVRLARESDITSVRKKGKVLKDEL